MSRPRRIEFPGAFHHVMNRGARAQPIFEAATDRRLFLATLRDSVERFRIEIHAWCLMGNHFHLLAHTPDPNLGAAMKHLGATYTQRFNVRHRLDGPLFRGRYKSIVIDGHRYFLAVSRYIHLNPVEAGLAARPEQYDWSSYRLLVEDRPAPRWLTRGMTLAAAGGRDAYRELVEQGVDSELRTFYDRQRLPGILGSDEFIARVAHNQPQPFSQPPTTDLTL